MRLSELRGKEIIDLNDGIRIGTIEECELYFDEETGEIRSMLLPGKNSLMRFLQAEKPTAVPWTAIKKISNELVIVNASRYGKESTWDE